MYSFAKESGSNIISFSPLSLNKKLVEEGILGGSSWYPPLLFNEICIKENRKAPARSTGSELGANS
jgi:hypothetical protein